MECSVWCHLPRPAQPSPAQPSFSVNWFALRLYTFMVLVLAVAARHRRRSYRNDETGHGPGHHSQPALALALLPRILELSRLTSVHHQGEAIQQH